MSLWTPEFAMIHHEFRPGSGRPCLTSHKPRLRHAWVDSVDGEEKLSAAGGPGSCKIHREYYTGWWFQWFFSVHNIWDNPSHWLIFFKMVKTTNHIYIHMYIYIYIQIPKFGFGILDFNDWLVVWNMFYDFPYIGNHPNWLVFFKGLKPPTRIEYFYRLF